MLSKSPLPPNAATFVCEQIRHCGPNDPEGLEFTTVAEQLYSLECHGDPFIIIFPTASAVSHLTAMKRTEEGTSLFHSSCFSYSGDKAVCQASTGETEEE